MFGELTEEQKLEKNVVKIFGENVFHDSEPASRHRDEDVAEQSVVVHTSQDWKHVTRITIVVTVGAEIFTRLCFNVDI